MATSIAINGFGRIGRLFLRALTEKGLLGTEFKVVAVNDLVSAENFAYLLRYDSSQGAFGAEIKAPSKDLLLVNGQEIQVLGIREGPAKMPWKALGVDIVIESTGLFTHADRCSEHLKAGAQKVVLTAPGAGAGVKTVVLGINDAELTSEDAIASNASCTTNCLAPIAKVVLDNFGIAEGLMSTVHAYTATQKTVDGASPKDYRGGRTAAMNIIPSSTGAAKAVGLVLPELKGKLTGMSFRVPTPTVSVVDLTVRTEKPTSYEAICTAMQKASQQKPLSGILGYTEDPVVSSDFLHDARSSIFDAKAGIGLNDTFFKLVAWYDNEWGYSNRCVELTQKIAKLL